MNTGQVILMADIVRDELERLRAKPKTSMRSGSTSTKAIAGLNVLIDLAKAAASAADDC